MLRNWRKRIRAQRLGTPIKTKQGTYKIPCTEYVRIDGEVCYEVDAKSIKLVVIADQLGTDDPDVVMREYTRREFISYVRRVTESEIESQEEAAGPQFPPVYHKPGKLIAFPGTEVEQFKVDTATPASNGTSIHQSETLGHANVLACPVDVVSPADEPQSEPQQAPIAEDASELQSIINMPIQRQPTEEEIVQAAIDEVLEDAETDEDRELLRAWMERHADYVWSAALDDHVRFSLTVYEGVVYTRYARYTQPVARKA